MKIEWESVMRSVIIALLLALITAAHTTYVEVKLLRQEVNQIWTEINDQAQKH